MPPTTLKILRELKGYKQEQIAEVLATTQNTYSRIERDPKRITAEQIDKLTKFYGVSVENLLSETPPVITFCPNPHKVNNDSSHAGVPPEIQCLREEVAYLRKQNLELIRALGSEWNRKKSPRNNPSYFLP